ncbi:MAG: alpha/beta fold hydrolase [Alphaproteobacteria bacterium]|nr:alpha/beta fold hydrolase [Alphaproteobacteria bacterium]
MMDAFRMADEFRSLSGADAVFTVATPDGARLPVYELRAPAAGPALLLGHANGLPAGSYEPWLKALARDVHVFAFDARGHGGAAWPAGPLEAVFHIDRFAEDLRCVADAVAARIEGTPLYYLGHSLGGAAALDLAAAGNLPDFAGVMLIEPPVVPPPDSPVRAEAEATQMQLVERARRRRADWPSIEAFHARLKSGNHAFARFAPEMLEAHCRAALKPKPDGGFTLATPPAVEAMIFTVRRHGTTWQWLDRIERPLDLIGGDPNFPDRDWVARAVPEMARRMKRARLTQLAGIGHLMMQEDPKRLLALVRRWLGCA